MRHSTFSRRFEKSIYHELVSHFSDMHHTPACAVNKADKKAFAARAQRKKCIADRIASGELEVGKGQTVLTRLEPGEAGRTAPKVPRALPAGCLREQLDIEMAEQATGVAAGPSRAAATLEDGEITG